MRHDFDIPTKMSIFPDFPIILSRRPNVTTRRKSIQSNHNVAITSWLRRDYVMMRSYSTRTELWPRSWQLTFRCQRQRPGVNHEWRSTLGQLGRRVWVDPHLCKCVCKCVCVWVFVCLCMWICLYVCVCMYECMCTLIGVYHAQTHTHIHTHLHKQGSMHTCRCSRYSIDLYCSCVYCVCECMCVCSLHFFIQTKNNLMLKKQENYADYEKYFFWIFWIKIYLLFSH